MMWLEIITFKKIQHDCLFSFAFKAIFCSLAGVLIFDCNAVW